MGSSLFACILFLAAVAASQASRIRSQLYTQGKTANEVESRTKIHYLPEWINISVKGEPQVKVPLGGILVLECEAIGSPPPRIRWYHHSNFLKEASFPEKNEVDTDAIGKIKSRIVVDCVLPHHQGMYTCRGSSGKKKKIVPPVNVVVEESADTSNFLCDRNAPAAPLLTIWGPTLLDTSGRNIVLPCAAVGYPKPDIYWLNNAKEIIDSDTISPHYKILQNGNLQINQLVWEDMGTFTCIAQNSMGQVKGETFLYPMRKEE